MKKILIIGLVMVFALNTFAQSKNTVYVEVDPNDWNQIIYTGKFSKVNVGLFFWVKPNGDQLARVLVSKNSKVTENFSVTYGGGPQIVKTNRRDVQVYALMVPKYQRGKVTATSVNGFNISFTRPLAVKNVTLVMYKTTQRLSLGYESQILFNKRRLLENDQGVKADYKISKHLSLQGRVYYDLNLNRIASSVGFTTNW